MPASPFKAAARKVRVLVAEDEQVLARTLAAILDLGGYPICALYGGAAVRVLLDVLQPELVVMDVDVPGTPAVEAQPIKELPDRTCRVLLLGEHPGVLDLLRAASLEHLDLLQPPVRAMDLLRRLRPLLCTREPALLIPIPADDLQVH